MITDRRARTGRPTGTTDRQTPADAGITLIELVVTMTIMSIVMVIFTSGILRMYQVTDKTESTSIATSQVNTAFLRLDGQIRYASGISSPAPNPSSNPAVRYLLPAGSVPNVAPTPNPTASGASGTCVELSWYANRLWYRTWPVGTGPSGPGVPLISSVTTTPTFNRITTDSNHHYQYQRLEIALRVAIGTAAGSSTVRNLDITFTALNAPTNTSSDSVCAY